MRWWLLVPVALLLSIVAARVVRVAIDRFAAAAVRRALAGLDGVQAEFERLHVSLVPLRFEIARPIIVGAAPLAYASARSLEIGLSWRALLVGRLSAIVRVEAPQATLVVENLRPRRALRVRSRQKIPAPLRTLPLRIDRLELVRGEALLVDTAAPGRLLLVRELEATAENIALSAALADGKPATAALHGKLAHDEIACIARAAPDGENAYARLACGAFRAIGGRRSR